MKLLISKEEIKKEFERLMHNYSKFYWTVAWAGADFEWFEKLKNNRNKIKKIVVGCDQYNTDPEFINTFNNETSGVRFFKQGNGTFHPKIYLFQADNEGHNWEILIGSMNFTNAGFDKNTEALILITSNDVSSEIYKDMKKFIEDYWEKGKIHSNEEIENYKKKWEEKQKARQIEEQEGEEVKKPEVSVKPDQTIEENEFFIGEELKKLGNFLNEQRKYYEYFDNEQTYIEEYFHNDEQRYAKEYRVMTGICYLKLIKIANKGEEAKEENHISYEELKEYILSVRDYIFSKDTTKIRIDIVPQMLYSMLAWINIYEGSQGRPMLSAVVVHKSDPLKRRISNPGEGFFKLAQQLGKYNGSKKEQDKIKFWSSEVKKVWNYWSKTRIIQ